VTGETLLSVRGGTVRFVGIVALNAVNFDAEEGKICGLIGPKGAGKTTLFKLPESALSIRSGDILFKGVAITDAPVHTFAEPGNRADVREPRDVPRAERASEHPEVDGCHLRKREDLAVSFDERNAYL